MKEMITVKKEVYEAVLRNSVRVNDLEAENQRLREMVLNDVTMERAYKLREENQQLNKRLLDMMDLLQKCCFYLNTIADGKVKTEHLEQIKTLAVLIDNAIGEK